MKSLIHCTRFHYWNHSIKRKAYSIVQPQDIRYFTSLLSKSNVITDTDQLAPHNICFRKLDKGNSQVMLLPKNTQQVSTILKYCNDKNIAVVPQGGNTGLVGGSVPVFDQIIINMKKMNKIEGFNQVSSVAGVEAGVVLQKLNEYLLPYGYQVPLDLGAKGSCFVGGNAATNAGGKYVIKYGSFRSNILGLQAVLPNGQILDLRSQIHKDNTGYDLKHLFIGSQGSIGIITKLDIHCAKIDDVKKIMVFKTDNYQLILNSLTTLRKLLGKNLAALEYVDGITYHTVLRHLHPPIFDKVQDNQHLLFVQASTQDLDEVFQAMGQFKDAIVSNNDQEYNKIWKIRQDVAVAAVKQQGKVLAYDISFDVRQWKKLIDQLRQSTKTLVLGYGHIGDGNLHVNIILKQSQQFKDNKVFQEVTKRKGSISAQHGVGLHKPNYLHLQKSNQILDVYKQLKHLFDPKGIMNPYKVIPQ